MDFAISPEIEDYRARISRFVEEEIIPLEADRSAYDAHGNINEELLGTLRSKAKAAGLWCLQLKPETGGKGLGKVGMAVCYEEMNRSIFGPVVFNSAAPDDGNMMVLEQAATDAQKERWLAPIVDGRVRSAFAMTEPQMVHHRRRDGAAFYPDGAHFRRSTPGAHGLPLRPGPAWLAH
jgi:acyl-CoA dehydrogenase